MQTTTAPMTLDAAARPRPGAAPRRPGSWGRFARHFGEMMLAMAAGMLVLGGAIAGIVSALGGSVGDADTTLAALVMAATMTIPMVAWMHYRHRMAPARSAEMAAAMFVPTFLAIGLYWAGILSSHGVMMVEHVLMVPAMLGVMLWRRPAYSH